jgi:hypothetical protein
MTTALSAQQQTGPAAALPCAQQADSDVSVGRNRRKSRARPIDPTLEQATQIAREQPRPAVQKMNPAAGLQPRDCAGELPPTLNGSFNTNHA